MPALPGIPRVASATPALLAAFAAGVGVLQTRASLPGMPWVAVAVALAVVAFVARSRLRQRAQARALASVAPPEPPPWRWPAFAAAAIAAAVGGFGYAAWRAEAEVTITSHRKSDEPLPVEGYSEHAARVEAALVAMEERVAKVERLVEGVSDEEQAA